MALAPALYCDCRHLWAHHDVALVDGAWVVDPDAGCAWRDGGSIQHPQTGNRARGCGCPASPPTALFDEPPHPDTVTDPPF
jgi:hypothetical protein